MVEWSRYFDSVVVIHYLPNRERLKSLQYQLDKIGLLNNPILSWEYTMPNPFEESAYKTFAKKYPTLTLGQYSGAMAHYHAIRSSYELGHERILVLENDIAFHKEFANYVVAMPSDADLIMFDYNAFAVLNHATDLKELYHPFTTEPYYQSAAYVLNRRYMKHYIDSQETMLREADAYLRVIGKKDDLRRYITNIPTVIQVPDDVAMGAKKGYVKHCIKFYEKIGLNQNDYILTEKQKENIELWKHKALSY